jgi:hypothetical protein
MESDFNQCNRLLLGQPIMHKLEDSRSLPDVQHGSRLSKLCHSTVLNKCLTYEMHQYKKQTIAYLENNAVGCFDRIANPLVLIFLQILGISATAVALLAQTWENTYHTVKTLYGISKECYTNNAQRLLYGPGQGSTIGPFLWLLCFYLIFQSLSNTAPRITLSSVSNEKTLKYVGKAFVDDTGL